MMRNLLFVSVLALGPAIAVVPAQHVSVGIGSDGFRLRIGSGHTRPIVPVTGHWEVQRERVWVEGRERVVHVPASYAWRRDACGRLVRVCVREAYDHVVCEPGRWEWQERRVWVPHTVGHGHRHHGHGHAEPVHGHVKLHGRERHFDDRGRDRRGRDGRRGRGRRG